MVAIDHMSPQVALFLVNAGADLHKSDVEGRQALHYAARYGFHEVVGALLKKGVKPDKQGSLGSPLMEAVAGTGDAKTISALINAGASVRCGTDDGGNLLHLAAAKGNATAARLLLGAGVSPLEVDRHGNRPSALAEDPITGIVISDAEHRMTEMGCIGSRR